MSPYRSEPTGPRQRRQRPLGPGDPRQPDAKRQGLTRTQVDVVLAAQDGRCALCRRPLGDYFHVDHDHVLASEHGHPVERGCPRCVRGIMCHGCNSFLSGFRDDPAFLLRAAEYAGRRRAR